jgi:hypothetical protein
MPQGSTVDGSDAVDLARFNRRTDLEYWRRVRRTKSIKTYLNWPEESREFRDRLLRVLLTEGYSIDQLYNADFAVRPALHSLQQLTERYLPRVEDELRKKGLSEEEIQRMVHQRLAFHRSNQVSIIAKSVGLLDEAVAQKLLAVAEGYPRAARPTPVDLVDGEPILNNDAWLIDEWREAAAQYRGPPRKYISKGMEIEVFSGISSGN